MDNKLKISVTRESATGKVFRGKSIAVREKILKFLFGDIRRMMILVPEGTVSKVSIIEDGGDENG